MPDDPRMHAERRPAVTPDAGVGTKPQVGLVVLLLSVAALLVALALFFLG